MVNLVDTHCHIHSSDYPLKPNDVIKNAQVAGVSQLICVGTDLEDSKRSVSFTSDRKNLYSSVGLHPHDAKLEDKTHAAKELQRLTSYPKVVAIGECGLDYYYNHSPKSDQIAMLELQLEIAISSDLPLIFHVRDAFDDFWPVFDNFSGLKGVIHSFTSDEKALNKALERGLFLGLNGITTFTKDKAQLEVFRKIPTANLVLETDAPFLTPVPFRGTICQPKHMFVTAEFLAGLRSTSLAELAQQTTANAKELFKL